MIHVMVRNQSTRKRVHRTDDLRRLAEVVCDGEGFRKDAELSVLLCDNPFISELNRRYRRRAGATDVLAFAPAPEAPLPADHDAVLGDIVVSLETVEAHCGGDREAMREELRLLFCHGLMHLLGCTHETAGRRRRMLARQAEYLAASRGGRPGP